jgi:TolA-binding protein
MAKMMTQTPGKNADAENAAKTSEAPAPEIRGLIRSGKTNLKFLGYTLGGLALLNLGMIGMRGCNMIQSSKRAELSVREQRKDSTMRVENDDERLAQMAKTLDDMEEAAKNSGQSGSSTQQKAQLPAALRAGPAKAPRQTQTQPAATSQKEEKKIKLGSASNPYPIGKGYWGPGYYHINLPIPGGDCEINIKSQAQWNSYFASGAAADSEYTTPNEPNGTQQNGPLKIIDIPGKCERIGPSIVIRSNMNRTSSTYYNNAFIPGNGGVKVYKQGHPSHVQRKK